MAHAYDSFAPVYGAWTASAPVCASNLAFYRDLYVAAALQGPVIELGIGDGRIALEACEAGASIIGVDASPAMLELCRAAAERRGLSDRVKLQLADFRDFTIPEPAELITIPFHSIGHLIEFDDKLAALEHIRANLRPDGRFVFDHFVFGEDYARAKQGLVHHRASLDVEEGHCHVFEASTYDFERQAIRILIRADTHDRDGLVLRSRYSSIDLSWITPEQSSELLGRAGFRIESVFGGFNGEPFESDSRTQVWVARAN